MAELLALEVVTPKRLLDPREEWLPGHPAGAVAGGASSKTPDLVLQEFYELMMMHFAIRGLMHNAALQDREDPGRLSFLHAVRVVRRKLPQFVAIPLSGEKSVS